MSVLDLNGLPKRPTGADQLGTSDAHQKGQERPQRSSHVCDETTSEPTLSAVASDVARSHADPITDGPGPVDAGRLLEEVYSCTETVLDGIARAKHVSESEIFAIGEVLRDIVNNARALTQEMQQDVTEAIAEQEQSLRRFSEGVRDALQAQEAAVECVVGVTQEIKDAVITLNSLNRSAALLAINASIESAHLGEKGRAFAVISQQMRELSKTISMSAEKVGSATTGVQERLQQITGNATVMQMLAATFVDEAAEQRQTATSLLSKSSADGNTRLESILQLSNTAVSHLQFQDPMIQQLERINGRMTQLRDWLLTHVSGDHTASTPADDVAHTAENIHQGQGNAVEPTAGEVMLF